jgi:outer membrane usher protein FimD/PapC
MLAFFLLMPSVVFSQAEGDATQEQLEEEDANFIDSEYIDEGFIPGIERTLFDLYASDAFSGGILANYTEEWCEVDDPIGALEQLPNIVESKVEDAISLLIGKIKKTKVVEGVGKVLCDIYTFRLVIELEPQFFKAESRGLPGYLPAPESGFSFQQNVGVAATREVAGDTNAAFTHRTVIGSGRYYGRFNGAGTQDGDYELLEASGYGYVGDFEIGTGFLETTGQTFTNSLQFAGVRVRTSDGVLLNPQDGRGSILEVFIPSRSRVEFYRAGRLLTVQMLDFGLQEINTTRFPQGSYDVDIVITETNGNVTRDRKFFTKSGFLTIRGRPSYDFQVGLLREEFSLETTPVVFGGVQWRASDHFDLNGSLYATDELGVGQAQISGLYRDTFFQGATSVSSNGDVGVNGNIAAGIAQGLTVSLSGAKTLKVSESSAQPIATPTPTPDPLAPPELIPDRQRSRELFFQDRTLYLARVRKGFGRLEIDYQVQGEQVGDGVLRRTRGPSFGLQTYDDGKNFVRLNGNFYETEAGSARSGVINYRRRINSQWNVNAQVGYYDRDVQDEIVGLLTVDYNEQRRAMYASKLSLSSEVRERSALSSDSNQGTVFSNQVSGDYGGDHFYGRGFFRSQEGDSAGSSSFGLNLESAILLGNDGSAAISYPMAQEAVFIANLKGNVPGTKFDLFLNDQRYDTISAGKRSAVSVPPFQVYRVSIQPTDPNELIDYDTTTYSISFFPGNVIERTWEVTQVTIVLGRLLDKDGVPIALQRIKGTREYVATDDLGYFQAELAGDEQLLVERDGVSCTIILPQYEPGEYFYELGDVTCE